MANTFELIASSTVGSGGASDITFSSIPSTYTDLLVDISVRTSQANTSRTLYLRVNGSSTSWTQRSVYGTGSAAGSDSTTGYGSTFLYCGECNGSTSTASTFTNTQVYATNYAGSTNKSFSVDSAQENNATGAFLTMMAGLWSNTSAITSILIAPDAGSFVQYSTAYLYGVKNA